MGDGRWKELSNITGGVSMGWGTKVTSLALLYINTFQHVLSISLY